MIHRLLYSSLTDISLPNGPGVNERGFLKDMLGRFGDRLLAVIPRPQRGLPSDLAELKTRYIPLRGSVRAPLGWAQMRALGGPILGTAIRQFRPDLVVLRTGTLPLPHLLGLRGTGVPWAVKTAGDVTHQAFYRGSALRRLARGLNERIFDRVIRGARAVDVVSDAQRDLLVERFPELRSRVAVIDNGVDLELFRPTGGDDIRAGFGIGPEDIVVGYVGNHPFQRGGGEVVRAVAALSNRYSVKGVVVGDTGEAERCRDLAQRLGVSSDVTVYGEAPYSDVPGLMAAMDIGLSILRPRDRFFSEQKVRQYMASGLCVVNTAGTNTFLQGRGFARIVDSEASGTVIAAVESLVARGRPALTLLGREAHAYASAHLSLAARNDRRMELWEKWLSVPQPNHPVEVAS